MSLWFLPIQFEKRGRREKKHDEFWWPTYAIIILYIILFLSRRPFTIYNLKQNNLESIVYARLRRKRPKQVYQTELTNWNWTKLVFFGWRCGVRSSSWSASRPHLGRPLKTKMIIISIYIRLSSSFIHSFALPSIHWNLKFHFIKLNSTVLLQLKESRSIVFPYFLKGSPPIWSHADLLWCRWDH